MQISSISVIKTTEKSCDVASEFIARVCWLEFVKILIFITVDIFPERVQILGHVHILCITVWEKRSICCQIFFDLLLKSAFERIFNVMQLILVKIKRLNQNFSSQGHDRQSLEQNN
jgi:hypothetical protein